MSWYSTRTFRSAADRQRDIRLFGGRLLHLHQHQLERLVAGVFGQMLAGRVHNVEWAFMGGAASFRQAA